MLRSLKELKGYVLKAEDDELGRSHDFLIDEQAWTVRYMVADTRRWLPGRKVLISPISLGDPDWSNQCLPVRLTGDQIKNAPPLDENAPVTREYEIWYHKHYGWPYYWSGAGLWSSAIHPRALYVAHSPDLGDEGPVLTNPNLHSLQEIIGYDINARDGEIGHLEDLIIDDDLWNVMYAAVATRNWLPGKRVLVPLSRIQKIDWEARQIVVDLDREAIQNSPEYDPSQPVNREFEMRIYDYVGRPHDWRSKTAESRA